MKLGATHRRGLLEPEELARLGDPELFAWKSPAAERAAAGPWIARPDL